MQEARAEGLPAQAGHKNDPRDPNVKERHEQILQHFGFEHLPAHLQEHSRPFHELAHHIVRNLPANPERTVALRKLLEAKDAAVRARLHK